MPESLEELRAQRALIQKHLDWLDRQIAGAEKTPTDALADTTEVSQVPTAATEANRTIPLHTPKVAVTEPASTEAELPIDSPEFKSNSSDLRSAQIGCVSIFIAIGLLFIFLLFGLPYLID